MKLLTIFSAAWHALWVLRKQRREPAWAQVLVCTGLAAGLGASMMLLTGLLTGLASDGNWWRQMGPVNLTICVIIGNTLLALFRGLEIALPAHSPVFIADRGGWRTGVRLNAVALAGLVLGFVLAMGLLATTAGRSLDHIVRNLSHQGIQVRMLLFVIVAAALHAIWWRMRANQRAQHRQATESQLRLLQAQIEPHFLFNTLANV